MAWFENDHRDKGQPSRRLYAMFEIVYTIVDVSAAACFLAGSILFLWEDLMQAGTWLFIVGSVLFAAKPVLRFARELKLASEGDEEDLAKRAES